MREVSSVNFVNEIWLIIFDTSRARRDALDYFLARCYSVSQGRFTSTDEFTGGPDELFDFADTAAGDPTFKRI